MESEEVPMPSKEAHAKTTEVPMESEDAPIESATAEAPLKRITLMTDEGPGFKEAAQKLKLNHVFYDRKHFSTKITQNWGGLSNPQKFKNDMYRILDETDPSKLKGLVAVARSEYKTNNAQDFIQHLWDNRHHVCFAYTHKTFTAGHVSDQRSEGGMSALKANGKLKEVLAQSTFAESIDRIMACVRKTQEKARVELVHLRQFNKKVST